MVAKLSGTTVQRHSYPSDLMDQVLGILDSKIQYQEFKINQAVKSYVDLETIDGFKNESSNKIFAPILENNARVIDNIDKASNTIRLLYVIRKELKHENASKVLTLFSDKRFEQFTAQGLRDYFERPWMKRAVTA